MRILTFFLCIMIVTLSTQLHSEEKILHYVIFPAPPFMIADDEKSEISGIDVEIVTEIAKRGGYTLHITKATWARCISLIENGLADIISSTYKKPERELFIQYFDTPYIDYLPISFYYMKGSPIKITVYEDLYEVGYIGVLNEASYFEQFDNDKRIKKYAVTSQDLLFPMLLKGRITVMAGYVPTENYRIHVEGYSGKVEKSSYEYTKGGAVYIGFSKKSPRFKEYERINKINDEMISDGTTPGLVKKYYDRYQ